MSSTKRNYLICDHCHLVTDQLPTHLKRTCMKNDTQESRLTAVKNAKERVHVHIRDNFVLEFDEICSEFSDLHERQRVVSFMEKKGHIIKDKPRCVTVPEPNTMSHITEMPELQPTDAISSPSESDIVEISRDPPPSPVDTNFPSTMNPVGEVDEETVHHVTESNSASSSTDSTVEESQTVLKVAKPTFLAALKDAEKGDLDQDRYLRILNYLTAVLCLRHFQRKSVVENIRVSDWLNSVPIELDCDQFRVIYVKDNKTGTTQPASFCLSMEEYNWFSIYFSKARQYIVDTYEDSQTDYFFLACRGKKIYNASNDLDRFHKKFRLPPINTSVARRTMEMATRGRLSGSDLTLVEDYLSHTASVSGRFSRFKTPINVLRARILLSDMDDRHDTEKTTKSSSIQLQPPAESSSSSSADEPRAKRPRIAAASHSDLTAERRGAFRHLKERYPITIDGKSPSLKECSHFYDRNPKSMVNSWNLEQKNKRAAHICDLRQFHRRRPHREEIESILKERNWPINILLKVMATWKPDVPRKTQQDDRTSMAEDQSWTGLCIVEKNERGNVACVTRDFEKGEVVCDYHGEVLTKEDGERRQNDVSENGYIMFCSDFAIDATSAKCRCHPSKTLYGRLISHSRKGKKTNLKPFEMCVNNDTCVLFKATKRISAGDELFFDYGVKRGQFNEGRDLEWLDS